MEKQNGGLSRNWEVVGFDSNISLNLECLLQGKFQIYIAPRKTKIYDQEN